MLKKNVKLILVISSGCAVISLMANLHIDTLHAQIEFDLENKVFTNLSRQSLPIMNSAIYKSVSSNSHIFGEVLNNNTFPVSFVKVYAAVYDSSGNVIATSSGHVRDSYLRPSQKSGFWILIQQDVPKGSKFTVDSTFEKSLAKPESLKLNVHLLSLNPVLIEGTVTNVGNKPATSVQVSATFYDQNHIVVDSDYDYIFSDIAPLDEGSFSLKPILNYENREIIKSVALNAESLEYTMMSRANVFPQ